MKKTLIALTLATLPVAAMAEVVLYGQIKAGYEFESTKVSGEKRGPWVNGLTDYGSRIGFKGQEDLGNGLKAIWQVEQRVGVDGVSRGFGTRDSFIGLEGGFGKVRAGYLSNYINSDMNDVDQWEYGSEALGLDRFGRDGVRRVSVRYDSPDFAGFNFAAQYSPRDNNLDRAGALGGQDKYGLGVGYANSGFFAKYSYEYLKHNARENGNKGKWSGHVHQLEGGYDANNIFAAIGFKHNRNAGIYARGAVAGALADAYNFAHAQHLLLNPGDANGAVVAGNAARAAAETAARRTSGQEVALTGGYHFGNVFPKISYVHGWDVKSTEGSKEKYKNTKYDQVVLGADYSFSKRTTANAQVGWLREGLGEGNGKQTTTAFGAGLKHKF